MDKKFNIHDWQAKQHLTEHIVTFTKKDMVNLHKKGKIKKKDDTGKEHTYVFKGDLKEAKNCGCGQDPCVTYGPMSEQNDDRPPNWRELPGYNPDHFYSKDSLISKMKSQESMSNADIKALQTVVGNYSLNKVLNTLAVIADKTGKHDESKMIKDLASKIQDFDQEELDEMNTTGGGASFNAGSGGGYMTPNAFRKKNKED